MHLLGKKAFNKLFLERMFTLYVPVPASHGGFWSAGSFPPSLPPFSSSSSLHHPQTKKVWNKLFQLFGFLVSVIKSAHVKRFIFSRIRDFILYIWWFARETPSYIRLFLWCYYMAIYHYHQLYIYLKKILHFGDTESLDQYS